MSNKYLLYLALGLAAVALVVAVFRGGETVRYISESLNLGAVRAVTTISNPWTFEQEVVINEDGVSQDTRIEGDTNANLALFDASEDAVTMDNFTHGSDGGCYSTTTTGVFSEANFLGNSCIYISAAGGGQGTLSMTLPATSTMTTLIPSQGDCRAWFVDASDVAAGTTTTFVAGTGHDVVGLDATGAGTGADVLDGNEFGKLTMCRSQDTDVITYVEEWIHAD